MLWSTIIAIIGFVIQTAAQNIAMFLIGRFIVGLGKGGTFVVAPLFLAETLPDKFRALGLGVFNDCYHVGALLSAVDYITSSKFQIWLGLISKRHHIRNRRDDFFDLAMASTFCTSSYFCHPIYNNTTICARIPKISFKGRHDEALLVLAQTHSNRSNRDI